jgi:hypothetical protein
MGFLKNTQKIRFESKKLWSQAIVQKGLKIYIRFQNAYVFPPSVFRELKMYEREFPIYCIGHGFEGGRMVQKFYMFVDSIVLPAPLESIECFT